jgi:uncharacterized protein
MMTIETFLKEVPGKGIGLFTVNAVKKGAVVWKYESNLCKSFLAKDVEKMDPVARAFIDKYGYIVPGAERIVELDLDNARFMNHSDDPNTEYPGHNGYALRDISAGEEITCDYRKFDTAPLDFLNHGGDI